MPTKYQAQVMTPKAKPSHVRREAATLAQNASKDAVAERLKSATLQPLKTPKDSSSAAGHKKWRQPPTSIGRARIMLREAAKRIFDFTVGLALLIVATPIILIAALAIRLETKGSPFFMQTRLGKDGKAFKIVKLRGMFID